MSADFDFITDRLAVGNMASRAVPGFVAVVTLLATERPGVTIYDELHGAPPIALNPYGVVASLTADHGSKSSATMWLHIDIADGEERYRGQYASSNANDHDLDEYLDATTAFIAAHIARGCVLVHCGAGISRSVAVVVAYLCRYAGMSYAEALAFVKSKRPQATPCDAFAAAVKRWLRLDDLAATGPRR